MKLTAIILTVISFILSGCYTENRPFKMMNGYGQLIAVKTSVMEKPHYGWDLCMQPLLYSNGKAIPAPIATKANPNPLPPCAQEEFQVVDSNGTIISTFLGPIKSLTEDLPPIAIVP